MTQFQLICAGIFALVALLTYRTQVLAAVQSLLGAKPSAVGVPEVKQSVAVALVNDILAVTQLRDKLAAEQCTDGVEACTVLLRVLVEYKEPSKGVV